jgi:CheY-like chemotaxis protein
MESSSPPRLSVAPRAQAEIQRLAAMDSALPAWKTSPSGGGIGLPGDPDSVLTWVREWDSVPVGDPHLFVGMAPQPLRIWVNGKQVHTWSDPDANTSPVDFRSHAIRLCTHVWQHDAPNRIVVQVFPVGGVGRLPNLALLDRRDAVAWVWRSDLFNFVLPAIVMVTGLFLSVLFLILFFQLGRERWARVWFWLTSALFAFSHANIVFSSEEMPALLLWKVSRVSLCLAALAIVHLQLVQAGWDKASRRLLPWTTSIGLLAGILLLAARDHQAMETRFAVCVGLILGPSLCTNLVLAVRNFLRRRDIAEAWMLVGLVFFAIAGFHDLVVYLSGSLPVVWLYPLGFLALDFCMALSVSHDLVAIWGQNRQRSADLEFALHGQLQAKARAEEAMRTRNRFLDQMAHRFRTPLQGLSGALELRDGGGLTPEVLAGLENHLRSHVSHINDVIDRIDLEAGRIEIKPVVFDLVDLVGTWRLHPVFEGRGDSLLVLESRVRLRADRDRIERVVRTLLEYLVDKDRSCSLHGRVLVGDKGLEVEIQASRTIRPLLDPSEEHVDLSVALDLLAPLGGKMSIERERDLRLVFPVEVLPEEEPSAFEEDARPLVLLAEDDRVNARILLSLLGRTGCRTVHALDGAQACEEALRETPALILMDVMMPVMDGLEATRRIREDIRLRHIPVIGVTAHGNSADCLAAGMDEMLAKPVRAEQIRDLVSRYCPAPT